MNIVKQHLCGVLMVALVSYLASPSLLSAASLSSAFSLTPTVNTVGTVEPNQTKVLLDITVPGPGLDTIVHDASSSTDLADGLTDLTLRFLDANADGSYTDGELLVDDRGVLGVLESGDFHETGVLPTHLLQILSSGETNFVGYLDADANGSYSTGERILRQEMDGTLGTLATTPDPLPFNVYEKIIDTNENGSYDPYEPIIYDTDNSYSLTAGDDVRSGTSTNIAPLLRRFDPAKTADQKLCVNDSGSSVGSLDETDKFWWDLSGSCASFSSGIDFMLVGNYPLSSANMRAVDATNMAVSASSVWLGYWDDNNDGSYTCSRTGSCETLIKSNYINADIVAGVFTGSEEFFASSSDATHGCLALSSCIAWDESGSTVGTLQKETSLYHVNNTQPTVAYGFKHDILDVVDYGTVSNPANGLLRAFPTNYRFIGESTLFTGSEAIVAVTGSQTLVSASDIKKSGPVTLSAFPSTMSFTDKNGDGVRTTNEDLVIDVDNSSTYRSHGLQAITLHNTGTATGADLQSLSVYQESGSTAGWDANDALIGVANVPYFDIPITITGRTIQQGQDALRRLYVVGQLASSATYGETLRPEVVVNGIQFFSDLDGPSNASIVSTLDFVIGSTTDITPPSLPESFSASPGYGQNVLSWTLRSESDVAGASIRMSTTGFPATSSSGTEIYRGTNTSYVHTGTPGALYYYTVFAFDAAGNYSSGRSLASAMGTGIDITPPNPPSNIWASGGNAQITVSWQNPTSDFAQTVVRMSTTGYPSSTTSGTAVYAGSGTSVATGANNGTTYYFSLWATDASGNVSPRMIASATPSAPSVTTTPITLVPSGSLVKAGPSAVYYYSGGKRYVFPNESVFYSWFSSFDGLYTITDADMSTVPLGSRITMRPGTYMMKIQSDNRVWAIEPGGVRRWVPSETVANALYGPNWNQMIVDQDVTLWPDYTEGTPLTTTHANGTVLLLSGNTYVIENAFKRLLSSEGYTANRVQWKHVVQPIVSYTYPTASTISSYQSTYSNPTY